MLNKGEMLRQRKCCHVSVDMATLVFGVISAIISGCGVIAFATVKTWIGSLDGDEDYNKWLHDPESIHQTPTDKNEKLILFIQTMIYVLFLFICCLVNFIFSVFLCYGTKRRRPAFVKAYLVYGVVVAVLMLIRTSIHLSTGYISDGLIWLITCGVYFGILLIIKRTYEIIRAEQSPNFVKICSPEPCMKA